MTYGFREAARRNRARAGFFVGCSSLLGLLHCNSAHDFHLHDGGGTGASAGSGAGSVNANGERGGESAAGRGGSSSNSTAGNTSNGVGGSAGASSGSVGGSTGSAGESSGATGGSNAAGGSGGSSESAGRGGTSNAGTGGDGATGDDGGEAGTANGCAGASCMHDACSSKPCQNGGTCELSGSAYTCACTNAYFGANCETAHFEWIGPAGSIATAISADGKVAVGAIQSDVHHQLPARWTEETGYVALEPMTGSVNDDYATATNADGSVVVGQANGEAFRWTASDGVVALGAGAGSIADGVSSDGKIVVGVMPPTDGTSAQHLFRWTASGGTKDLGPIGDSGEVRDLSGDGTIVVGDRGFDTAAYLWTEAQGFVDLDSSSDTSSAALAISLDGGTVVGRTNNGAFVYTSGGGLVHLSIPNFTTDGADNVNGDGTVIGGYTDEGYFIWDAANGARMVSDIFAGYGGDAATALQCGVHGISEDGKLFTGFCSGVRAFVARL